MGLFWFCREDVEEGGEADSVQHWGGEQELVEHTFREDLSLEPGPAACASDWLDSLSIRLTGLPLHVLCSEISLLKLLSDPELNFTFLFLDLLMEKLFLGSAFVF